MTAADRAIARRHARFVLKTRGITASEAALALLAAEGLASLKTRAVAALTCGGSPKSYGLGSVIDSLESAGMLSDGQPR
jgi:hypothetical protein